jgi:hypothetical protein
MKGTVAYCRTGSALQSDPLRKVHQQAKAAQRHAKGRGVAIRETYMDAGVLWCLTPHFHSRPTRLTQ